MAFFTAALSAVRAASEVRGAWSAASDVLANGGSLAAAVQAFADRTDNRLDDAAVAELLKGLDLAIDYSTRAAVVLVRSALWVEHHGPRIVDGARRTAAVVGRFATRLEALRCARTP